VDTFMRVMLISRELHWVCSLFVVVMDNGKSHYESVSVCSEMSGVL